MRSVSLMRTDDLEKGCKCIMQLYKDSERSMNCRMQQKLEQRSSSVCSLGDLCDKEIYHQDIVSLAVLCKD
jgi:hypothetical protein